MTDWKKNAEDALKKKRVEEAKKQEEINRVLKERAEKERVEAYDRKLKNHQKNWKCHICGKPSSGPGYTVTSRYYTPGGAAFGGSVFSGGSGYVDWNSPTGLSGCHKCNKMACDDHIVGGRCQNAGINMDHQINDGI